MTNEERLNRVRDFMRRKDKYKYSLGQTIFILHNVNMEFKEINTKKGNTLVDIIVDFSTGVVKKRDKTMDITDENSYTLYYHVSYGHLQHVKEYDETYKHLSSADGFIKKVLFLIEEYLDNTHNLNKERAKYRLIFNQRTPFDNRQLTTLSRVYTTILNTLVDRYDYLYSLTDSLDFGESTTIDIDGLTTSSLGGGDATSN